jgi:hypothetical protein
MRSTLAVVVLLAAAPLCAQTATPWQSSFPINKKTVGVNGNNPYLPLTPGSQWTYKHGNDLEVITVLDKTKMIDGIECRPVEDREETSGQLVELTLDYYAIDQATNDVYYMGEDVDEYKNGKVVSHNGSWLSGVNGATFGMLLPGKPQAGQRFYQEQAPGSKDRIEIRSTDERITTPAGTFEHCILVAESSPIEKGVSHKWYARGIGAVKDAEMNLETYGKK